MGVRPKYTRRVVRTRRTRLSYVTSAKTQQALSGSAIEALIPDLPRARVSYIIDGDTVIISSLWQDMKIRLDSIDCPEDGQEWGDIATYALIKLIGRRMVHVEEHGTDIHGRILATLYVWNNTKNTWTNVNERMVTLGHAWVMRKYYDHLPMDRKSKLNKLERWAKSKKIGLWGTQNPVPPWQWRQNCDFYE